MLQLIEIYQWTILAGIFLSASLAILGCHLAARDKAMQTLCVGQGATLGVLLGIGILHSLEQPETQIHTSPVVLAILFSAFTFLFSDWIVSKKHASKNTYFSSLFVTLLAAGYLASAAFPALENHLSQVFFGDLATLSEENSIISLIVGIFTLAVLLILWKPFCNQSFEIAMFGQTLPSSMKRNHPRLFQVTTILILSFSVQYVGFLFTVGALFIPTVMMSFGSRPSLQSHLIKVVTIASLSTLIGFMFSLAFTRFPTVPSIVLTMVILGGLTSLSLKLNR